MPRLESALGRCKPLVTGSDINGNKSTVWREYAVLRTLCSRAHRIGLDGTSYFLCGFGENLSLDLFLIQFLAVLA
jgi:hypothetical protein